MRNHTHTQHFLLGLGLLLIAACSGIDSDTPADSETVASSQATLSATDSEYLFFASDAHLNDNPNTPIGNLKKMVTWAKGLGVPCERAALVGDSTPNESDMGTLKDALSGVSTDGDAVFAQGNHDNSKVDGNGPVPMEGNDKYQVFAISWDKFSSYNDALNNPLRTYLEATDFTIARNKVQIVLTHYPLHSSEYESKTQAAESILSVLQEFGKHMDIIVLWGHDHKHPEYDKGILNIELPGQNVTIRDSNRTLTFAYLNAGYITPKKAGLDPAATVIGMDGQGVQITRKNDDRSTTSTAYTRRRRIALRSAYNSMYACADLNNNRNGELYADRSAIGPWETFHLEELGSGQVALWAHATARYVTAENAGASRAVANRTVIGHDSNGVSWEIFDLIPLNGGYSFRSHTNNQHLRYDSFMPANPNPGTGSKFYMENAP